MEQKTFYCDGDFAKKVMGIVGKATAGKFLPASSKISIFYKVTSIMASNAAKAVKLSNKNLSAAKKAKKDEFYTQLVDIENEVKLYKAHFKGKTVLCNCDDPLESNFVKYFSLNFEYLGLKKLIATHYKESNLFSKEPPYVLEYTGKNGNKVPDPGEFVTKLLDDGDFRSPECEGLLEEADIVVTNPPFSQFRDYIAQLMQFKKKFLVMGGMNAITYKEIFPLIKERKIWAGYNFNKVIDFIIPKHYEKYHHMDEEGNKIAKVPGICWYTNLPVKNRSAHIDLYKKYSPEEYPKYDNYNAIESCPVVDIPMDYEGLMGVPISFLGKHNPEQFEIIWQACGNTRASSPKLVLEELGYQKHREDRGGCALIKGKRSYARIIIKNLKPKK